jgi:nitroimidazol reductase NimA-like FMN-containing flavoprotein (pyridoxamine 5'-phosphate oxidase superfamily)
MTTPSTSDGHADGGDLSRRVASRRAELGLTLEEVGEKAGIDPGYLAYLEHNAGARLSMGSLILLAMALKTSPEELLGGSGPLRRDHGGVGRHPRLQELSTEQCSVQLEAAAYGRLVYQAERGPVAIPVNYEYTAGQIVISTDPAKAERLELAGAVGFEVDRVDEALAEGWSVLVTGKARRVTDAQERQSLSSLGLERWPEGGEHELVAISVREITGRVIVHPLEPED